MHKKYYIFNIKINTIQEEIYMELLKLEGVDVKIEEKQILHDISLKINKGETHVIMGPNGAGKSTLGHAIMGNPKFEVTAGSILYKGEEINDESPDKRAKAGIYLSFQNPLEVPGVLLSNFVRTAGEQISGERIKFMQFRRKVEETLDILQMGKEYADRDLNVGFSGGEKKKSEIFQLLMLKPTLAILDEADSGLDVDAVRIVSEGVREYKENMDGTLLIITHSTRILQSLKVDVVHIMVNGRIVDTSDASLIEKINAEGFERYLANA